VHLTEPPNAPLGFIFDWFIEVPNPDGFATYRSEHEPVRLPSVDTVDEAEQRGSARQENPDA